jgi:hypothetical protein
MPLIDATQIAVWGSNGGNDHGTANPLVSPQTVLTSEPAKNAAAGLSAVWTGTEGLPKFVAAQLRNATNLKYGAATNIYR